MPSAFDALLSTIVSRAASEIARVVRENMADEVQRAVWAQAPSAPGARAVRAAPPAARKASVVCVPATPPMKPVPAMKPAKVATAKARKGDGKTSPLLRLPKDVIAEIRRRHELGHPLKSGANRGDWLYAAATKRFGSWGAAVTAAGYDYPTGQRSALTESEAQHLTRCECVGPSRRPDPLTKDEVLHRIRAAASRGELLRAAHDTLLASGARRHFGTWKAGIKAAGVEWQRFPKWTAEAVVARIRDDSAKGLSLYATDVIAREEMLYQSARRRFGSWGAALKAADPSLPKPRRGRPRTHATVAQAKPGKKPKPAAKANGKPAGAKGKKAGAKQNGRDALLGRVLGLISKTPGLRAEEITRQLGAQPEPVKAVLASLREAGKVKVSGKARGTSYAVA